MNSGNSYYTYKENETLNNEVKDISYQDIEKMYNENQRDEAECKKITQDSYDGKSFYDSSNDFRSSFFAEVLVRDAKTSGFMMQYPHGTIIRQAERNHYYRGENQKFPHSTSSLLRKISQMNDADKKTYEFIANMRIAEFKSFLQQFQYITEWEQLYGTVLYECLAQHYGLETYWLDITNDFNTALFFSVCYYDEGTGWHPLTKEITESCENKKYGYIFHMPQFQTSTQMMISSAREFSDKKILSNEILPIGFQPFERCHMQHAYGIKMEEFYPLQEDYFFEKLRFRHSEKLAKNVYELMDCGRKIYPHEGISDFKDIINIIKTTTTFSRDAFEYATEISDSIKTEKGLNEALSISVSKEISKNIQIVSKCPIEVSRQRRRNLDRKYKNFSIEDYYGIKLMTRFSYRG